MGISPGNAGKKTGQGKSAKMDDVATANSFIAEIGGKRHVGDMLRTALRELRERFPHRDDPENQWTERRLRGWWNNESRIVRHFQMVELYETAEALRKARDEHAEFIKETTRIRQMAKLAKTNAVGRVASRQGGQLG
ncbi:hypothetical protein [Rhizobium sp. RHZ02]|uniref:hypothetical protein n=1 Tax=Rhizobium sp. RHZ02 TaxID=2769306 RepID=UPI001FEF9DA1|nr:hypothetical protein [Rhizobium sp. RHZ02]